MAALAKTAEHLAAKGRHGDTMLVHMNPLEVAWMHSQTPGGLTINPDTGQPEAFAFLLPLLTGMAGPSIMGALGLSGTGALLGGAALTGLTDYAVNKDPKRALGSSLLSFATGGLSNAFKGAKAATDAVKAVPSAVNAATAALPTAVTNGASNLANVAMAANPTLNAAAKGVQALGGQAASAIGNLTTAPAAGGLLSKLGTAGQIMQAPRAAWEIAKANPLTIGLPGAAGAALTASSMMEQPAYDMPSKQDEKYKGDYQRERFPGKRTLTPYGGDYATYGLSNGEHSFFNPNNDRLASPPILGPAGLGAYGMAEGGAVQGAGNGVSDSIPAIGPGDRPIQLSDGEYVIPADVVSMLGHGSTNGGIRYLDQMIAKTRANPPRQEKGAPPQRRAA